MGDSDQIKYAVYERPRLQVNCSDNTGAAFLFVSRCSHQGALILYSECSRLISLVRVGSCCTQAHRTNIARPATPILNTQIKIGPRATQASPENS